MSLFYKKKNNNNKLKQWSKKKKKIILYGKKNCEIIRFSRLFIHLLHWIKGRNLQFSDYSGQIILTSKKKDLKTFNIFMLFLNSSTLRTFLYKELKWYYSFSILRNFKIIYNVSMYFKFKNVYLFYVKNNIFELQ